MFVAAGSARILGRVVAGAAAACLAVACAKAPEAPSAPPAENAAAAGDPAFVYAVIETSLGTVTAKLYAKQTPKTTENFTQLARGEKEWVDPRLLKRVKNPFYDGRIFHRVVPGFMIQGGCVLGTGTGQPGFSIEDEIVPELTFDRPGLLAMANAGPNTNDTQFFFTLAPTPHLNGRHTIFGEVIRGMDVVEAIGALPRDGRDRPKQPPVIVKVTILPQPPPD